MNFIIRWTRGIIVGLVAAVIIGLLVIIGIVAEIVEPSHE